MEAGGKIFSKHSNWQGTVILVLFCFILILSCDRVAEFEEMKRRTTIENGRVYFDILISTPSDRRDIFKQQIVAYYNRLQYQTNRQIASVDFYRKTRCSSYFLDHDENPDGLSFNYLMDCNDELACIISKTDDGNAIIKAVKLFIVFDKEDKQIFGEELKLDMQVPNPP